MHNRETLFCVSSLVAAVVLGSFCVANIMRNRSNDNDAVRSAIALPVGTVAVEVLGRNCDSRGPSDATYTLVEFGDYECPPCVRMHTQLNQLVDQAGGKLRLIFRNLPLTNIHAYAYDAALAAEAAGEQNKFWEMHDILYENSSKLTIKDLTGYATSLSLDLPRFLRALKSTAKNHVEADIAAAKRLGLTSTPTLILYKPNGKMQIVSISELKHQFSN